ncbi:hypothetical protein [Enterococcus faecium]|uniref:Uncharacterized protein n=1 Tax=Enterococcus faecium TaxID=1352 RepID=A0A242AMH3_ENTFC|nr:hypothetical protein [Enterococcus faecium]OTN82247.1 hypothetical protein A5810_003223 [Enterococcus faecium]
MTIRSIRLVDCYDQETGNYLGSFEKTNENILNYVASIPPYRNILLVDYATDHTLLTTIGHFLNDVPDQEWVKTILPRLIEKQIGEEPIEKVIIYNRYEETEGRTCINFPIENVLTEGI